MDGMVYFCHYTQILIGKTWSRGQMAWWWMITVVIIYMNKLFDFDWLKVECNTSATPVQKVEHQCKLQIKVNILKQLKNQTTNNYE